MNRKRFMKCHLLRRCGAVLLAAALSLSVLGTGSAFADTTETGEEIVEMTVSGDYEASVYEASIDEAGGYVYYAFTPEESGTYSFYTTGDYDTYAYIYDADWNELDSDDDSGSSLNAKITISLEAGNTYYIAFRFYSSYKTGSFSVYAEKAIAAVSAELVLSQELVLYEGLDSYEEYDDNDEVFDYYDFYELNFTSGDQIVLTLEDGSTVTCTSYGSVYFYDEDDQYVSFDVSDDQYNEHWEVGNTYYFTYTLTEYAIDVQIPVTIEENPYADATAEYVSEETYTLYEGIDSYTDYDDDDEEFEYYSYWNLSFSSSDQIVITLSDGSTITYTSDGYGDFYDEDGNYLEFYESDDQYSEHWETGGTYYYTLTLYDYGLTVQIPVTIAVPDPSTFTELVTDTEYTAEIEDAGGYVYYAFTPEESGTYRFYTTGDYDTYAYIYDADWDVLDSDDDSGSSLNAKITISLEAGNTYYIAFRFFSSDTTGSFSVYAEKVVAAVSAELVLSQELVLYEGLNSYEDYDDDNEAYEYYDFWYLRFSSSDQIVITLNDGSTITYTSDGYGNFYDEDYNYLDFDVSDDQYSEHWETGGTYYFTLTLSDYGLTVQIPVTIAVPDPSTFTELVTDTEYTAEIEDAGGYVFYAFTPEESGTYSFYTTGDYDTYASIYDTDWNVLDSDDDSGSSLNAKITISLEAGDTYYIVFRFYSSDTTGSFSVYAKKVVAAVSAELVLSQELVLYEGIDSYTYYDDDDEEFEYYDFWNLSFSSSDQIVLTLEDGSTVTYTSDGSVYFYDENDQYMSFDVSDDQYDEHWEVGNTYYFTYTLTDYGIDVQIPVTIKENPYEDATAEFVSEEGITLYEGINSYTEYDDDGEEFEYYDFWYLNFSSSDQIVITLNDGSTITYTADGYGDFYDEDGNYLEFYVSDDQYSEHWEAGGTYYYTMTLYNYGLTVQIPVTIAAPDFTSAVEMAADTAYTAVIGEAGGFVIYSFAPSETGIYTTYSTGDYDTYAYIFDTDGNMLSSDDDSGDDCNALITIDLDAGSTYYIIYRFYSASDTGSFSVYLEMTGSSESDDVEITGNEDASDDGGTTGDEDTSGDGGTTGDEDTSDDVGTTGDEDTSVDGGTTGDEDTSVDDGTTGDEDASDSDGTIDDGATGGESSSDDSSSVDDGSTGDEVTSVDDGSTGGGSTSDNDGSTSGVSNGDGSSDQQNSGQTVGGSTNLKTQKITVKKAKLKKTIKYKKLKKKAQTFKLKASTSGNGKITYKKVSGNKKIKVSKTGKVTVKKGLKKGKTYKVKVKITAAGTSAYKEASVTKTIKIKIK